MSAGTPTLPTLPARTGLPRADPHDADIGADTVVPTQAVVRLIAFAALALYGVARWSTLMSGPPTLRLLGLFALALALAGLVPLVRSYDTVIAAVLAGALLLAAFPVAGLHWHWFVHERIAVSASHIGDGLSQLPNVLVPYIGASHDVRLVIVLGAAVLLLDGAAVMAFAPRSFGDGRRAAAALPLIALAVVPSTLVRPQQPYLQGLILFVLLGAFVWGERLRRDRRSTAVAVAVVAGVVGAVVAPKIDTHRPWINYRSWAGTLVHTQVDSFNWNQTYGPLRWPRSGRQVLLVSARVSDYWKAEDLDEFDGREWVLGDVLGNPGDLPAPSAAAERKWTQKVTVSITGMRTQPIIGAGYSSAPTGAGTFVSGTDPGTWQAASTLGPGASYTLETYSPRPTPAQMRAVGNHYPSVATLPYRTLLIPQPTSGHYGATTIVFPRFHHSWGTGGARVDERVVRASVYGPAYALAQRLAAQARTPYDFIASVQRYLAAPSFRYDQDPPAAAYPLETFLFSRRLGYCQQFSGAMALLLRMGGIPARVAAGFTSGTSSKGGHTWQVLDTDAHAWVEAWFPQYGWVRFDPTPATAPARGGSGVEPLLKPSVTGRGGTPSGVRHPNAGVTSAKAAHHRSGSSSAWWLLIVGLLAAVALVRLAWLLLAPAGAPEQLLAELHRAMARSGRPLRDEVTLASLEQRFADDPAAVAYVRTLRLQRYGAGAGRPTAAQRRALRRQLAAGLGPIGWLRALWALPPRPRATSHRSHPARPARSE